MNADPLEWLLPEAAASERAELRRLVQALRLLHADLARPAARSVEPSWRRARGELEEVARREALRALETLLGAHLGALLPADAFLPLPVAPLALDAAWRVLVARGLCVPPRPGEPLAESARALVARGLALGAPGAWALAWRAQLEHAEHGRAPRRWARELARARAARLRPRLLARLVAGLAASELERGAPARALGVLEAHAPLARLEPALATLASWCAVLLGRAVSAPPAAVTPLPLALFELAREDPRFAAAFPGTPGAGALPPRALAEPRAALGATLLVLLERPPAGAPRVLRLEGEAPALAGALAHARAPAAPLERCWRFGAEGPLPGAAGGARTRALVRLALDSGDAGVARWLQLEWPHALVPCRARLGELARGFARSERHAVELPVLHAPDDPRAPLCALFLRRLRALGVTRVALLGPDAPARVLLAHGLGARAARLAREGEACARALGLATVELSAGSRRLARVHAEAPGEQVAAAFAPLAAEFLCASFRVHERARGRGDPWLVPAHLAAAADGFRGPFLVSGPPGSGRRTLARALLFAAGFEPDEPGRLATGASAGGAGSARVAEPDEPLPEGWREVRLAPLAARRAELAALLRHLVRTHVPPLAPSDAALAELWRRDWEGFPVLREVLAALAREGPVVEAADVRRVLAGAGLATRARRASEGLDLDLALDATRHRNGQPNRARAARWLGVGVARLRSAGPEEPPESERRQPCPWLAPPGSISPGDPAEIGP